MLTTVQIVTITHQLLMGREPKFIAQELGCSLDDVVAIQDVLHLTVEDEEGLGCPDWDPSSPSCLKCLDDPEGICCLSEVDPNLQ